MGLLLHWRRVVLAAAQLAAWYAFGVIVLLVLLEISLGGFSIVTDQLFVLPPAFAAILLACFGLLTVARRAGFTLLWLLLIGFWVWTLTVEPFWTYLPRDFLGWSALALPLYFLGSLGVSSSKVRVHRWSVRPGLVLLSMWCGLLVWGLFRSGFGADPHYPPPVPPLPGYVTVPWAAVPILIGVYESVRLWRALGPVHHAGGGLTSICS